MKLYKDLISLNKNDRGIWDLDVSKGCASGMAETKGGCYGDCYAARTAKRYGHDFSKTVLRHFESVAHQRQIIQQINKADRPFVRIGCSGDPSENWDHTLSIIDKIKKANKEIVIITRHWAVLSDDQLQQLQDYKICVNTSVSALDSHERRENSLTQYHRLKPFCKSFLRIVSCDFNLENETGLKLSLIQDELFKNELTIDTVFRPSKDNQFVLDGIVKIRRLNFLGSKAWISKFDRKAYLGKCDKCREQCGVFNDKIRRHPVFEQLSIPYND